MTAYRIMIVSQHALFREGLRRLLVDAPQLELLGVASSLAEAETMAAATIPDVIVVSREDQSTTIMTRLLDLTGAQVVAVTLNNREAVVYGRYGITLNSPQDLIETLQHTGGAKGS